MSLTGAAIQGKGRYGQFIRGAAFPALVFCAVFLYLWLYLNPAFLYSFMPYRQFPYFSTGTEFFKSFLPYQGGLIAYASAFLSQLYHWSWLGALIITSVAGFLCLATAGIFKYLGGTRVRALHYVPAILMLMLCSQFRHALAAALAVLTALLLVNLYMRLAPRNWWLAGAAFVALFGAAYYLTAGACLIFAALCAIFELLPRRRLLLGAVFVLLAPILMLLAGRYVFRIDMTLASLRLLPPLLLAPHIGKLLAALLLYCPAAGLLIALRNRFFPRRAPATENQADRSSVQATEPNSWVRIQQSLESPLLVLLAVIPLYYSLDSSTRTTLEFEYYSQNGMWRRLLREAERLPAGQLNASLLCDINRSLYRTDQLPENMFHYAQDPDGLVPRLKVNRSASCLTLAQTSDFFLDMGYLEESEHSTHELLDLTGEKPALLQRLALINIVKGEMGAARVFLGALSKDLLYGEEGRRDLERLKSDPGFTADPEVQRLRSLRLAEDGLEYSTKEEILQGLLKANRKNRMAFEYLMAYYLLECRPDEVAQNISRLDDFGYREIPRHYEEALLIQASLTGQPVDLHGRTIRAETAQRFVDLCKIIERHGNNIIAALPEVQEQYRDSYFWYFLLRKKVLKP